MMLEFIARIRYIITGESGRSLMNIDEFNAWATEVNLGHYLTFDNAKNLDEWLGVAITKAYRYFNVFHNEPVVANTYSLTQWVKWVRSKPSPSIIRWVQWQISWRLWRKRNGHTWLKWRL